MSENIFRTSKESVPNNFSTSQSGVESSLVESVGVEKASVAEQQNVSRALQNLWVNTRLSDNQLIQLQEKIASSSKEEIKSLNDRLLNATRAFANTRDVIALTQTLLRLRTGI